MFTPPSHEKAFAFMPDAKRPDRLKQHGFSFNADNCIACHACEAACSEKNDLPPYLAFRAVGFIEGGLYPAYQRLNISMACNHCDNPVCLKGCPTRAYTKFEEYGAVLQDPETCFGCGYCTWVCPFNAPQLDPNEGRVKKCNLCVDWLEEGRQPACSTACLGNALDFGIIDTTLKPGEKKTMAGFPNAEITQPNIRFQQAATLPTILTRPDNMPIQYQQQANDNNYQAAPDRDQQQQEKPGELGALFSSHENAHIIYSLTFQAVLGAFLLFLATSWLTTDPFTLLNHATTRLLLLSTLVTLLSLGLISLNVHLGKPHRAYRGCNNLRYSPLSREIAGVSLFFFSLLAYTLCILFENRLTTIAAHLFTVTGAIAGLAGFYYMYRLYRIKARPYWDHWQTASAFISTALTAGSLLLVLPLLALSSTTTLHPFLQWIACLVLLGISLEAIGLYRHAVDLMAKGGEAAAAHCQQITQYGRSYWVRNLLLGSNFIAAFYLTLFGIAGPVGWSAAGWLLVSIPTAALLSRALFFITVIPTTLPGAFFWRNKRFEAHARKSGLAQRPQTGVC